MSYMIYILGRDPTSDDEESGLDVVELGVVVLLAEMIAYFTFVEIMQIRQLKWDYLTIWNLIDIVSLMINMSLVGNSFTTTMTKRTLVYLTIFQAFFMGLTLFNWLRVFETTVLYV